MAKDIWEVGIGERAGGEAEQPDPLVAQTMADRNRKRITRADEEDEAKHKANMAKYEKETKASDAAVEKSEAGSGQEPNLRITGTINYADIIERQMNEREEARKAAEAVAGQQTEAANLLREKLHQADLQVAETRYESHIALINKMIEGGAKKSSFADELSAAREVAKELGFVQAQAGGNAKYL